MNIRTCIDFHIAPMHLDIFRGCNGIFFRPEIFVFFRNHNNKIQVSIGYDNNQQFNTLLVCTSLAAYNLITIFVRKYGF